MKVSVIVPVYNVEIYLKKCINSILNQTFRNLEIILVDDGSTDDSGIICDEYALIDERLKVIHKENGGLSSARNIGIDNATGDYLAFIDSDDWIEPNMLEVLLERIKQDNSDISICEYLEVYNEEEKITNTTMIENKIFTNYKALKNIYDNKLNITMTVTWNKLYKKELFKNITFPNGKIHEDEFTTYKLLYAAEKVSYINKKMYYYRQRENSIMKSKFSKKRLDTLDAIEERVDFMKDIVKDDELYNMTIVFYYNVIMNCYFLYQESNKDDYYTLKDILKRARKIYKIYFKASKESIKSKIIYSSFIIRPKLFKVIERISIYKNSLKEIN